jgi:glycine/D-amino acid oxidase-like deaminating enzyme
LVTSFTLSVCVPSAAPEPASPPHPLLPPWVDPSASAAPPRELGTPNSTAQVHPCLLTKAILAASGAEVVIAEVERVVVRDGRAAGVVVKGRERDGVVDADAVVLALGPWSRSARGGQRGSTFLGSRCTTTCCGRPSRRRSRL